MHIKGKLFPVFSTRTEVNHKPYNPTTTTFLINNEKHTLTFDPTTIIQSDNPFNYYTAVKSTDTTLIDLLKKSSLNSLDVSKDNDRLILNVLEKTKVTNDIIRSRLLFSIEFERAKWSVITRNVISRLNFLESERKNARLIVVNAAMKIANENPSLLVASHLLDPLPFPAIVLKEYFVKSESKDCLCKTFNVLVYFIHLGFVCRY